MWQNYGGRNYELVKKKRDFQIQLKVSFNILFAVLIFRSKKLIVD